MRKTVFFCAALAVVALTTLNSCSSDDELISESVVKGHAFTLSVSTDDQTRYAEATKDALNYLQLYALPAAGGTAWLNDVTFTKGTGDVWGADDANWPDDASTASWFYAYSENTATATGNVDAQWSDKKFTYTLPVKSSQESIMLYNGTKTVATNTDVIDLDQLNDLLVGVNKGTSDAGIKEGDVDGKLSMTLSHALAGLQIFVRFTSYEWSSSMNSEVQTGISPSAVCNINYVALHGLYVKANNSFSTTWDTSTGSKGYYRFVPTNNNIAAQHVSSASETITKTPLIDLDQLLIIPQTFTPWKADYYDSTNEEGIDILSGTADDLGQAYIEINCTFGITGKTTAKSYYLPLRIADGETNTFVAGRKYKVVLNLNFIRNGDGAQDDYEGGVDPDYAFGDAKVVV